MKKVLSFVLVLCLVVGCLPIGASALGTRVVGGDVIAYPVTGGSVYFNKVTGALVGADPDITKADIPEEIEGVPVEFIRESVFENCTALTEINLPNYTIVNPLAFKNCSSLKSFTFCETQKIIWEQTLRGCTSLTSVTIPDGTGRIEMGAFAGCTSLRSITIPSSVVGMTMPFENCTSLKDIYFTGTKEQWDAIRLEYYGSDALNTATIHFQSSGPSFTDVSAKDWFYKDAARAAELGIIKGKPGNKFDGLGKTTRRDFSVMLTRLMGQESYARSIAPTKSNFKGIEDGNSYLWSIQYVMDQGWMDLKNGDFRPMDYITREDVCIAIARALGLSGSAATFPDASEMSAEGKTAISAVRGAGIVSGYPDGSFKPTLPINRAAMAKIMALAYENR